MNQIGTVERLEYLARMAASEMEEACQRGAAGRAEALLRIYLSSDEWAQLSTRGYVEVDSPSQPGRRYRIPRAGGLVRLYEGKRLRALLCVQPAEPLPRDDVVLLHLVSIRGDEAYYLKTANTFTIPPTEDEDGEEM